MNQLLVNGVNNINLKLFKMNTKKLIIWFVFSALIIVWVSLFLSYTPKQSIEIENANNKKELNVEISTTTNKIVSQFKEPEITLNGEELSISWVKIKKGTPESLSWIIDSVTYVNSNVDNYLFFVKKGEIKEIEEYVKNSLTNQWWNQTEEPMLYSKDNSEISIFISEKIPNNLSILELEGTYVELYYSEKSLNFNEEELTEEGQN